MDNPDTLKFPIGKFAVTGKISESQIETWIKNIEELPNRLFNTVSILTEEQLDTPYRPEGWTIRQVVHHLGDSHLNSYIRFKLALTEDVPIVKTYDEAKWAELPDYLLFPIEDSLDFIKILHKRWVIVLKSLSDEELDREFFHPESGVIVLKKNIGLYSWHGEHHLAQITALINRMGWK